MSCEALFNCCTDQTFDLSVAGCSAMLRPRRGVPPVMRACCWPMLSLLSKCLAEWELSSVCVCVCVCVCVFILSTAVMFLSDGVSSR